MEFSPEMKRSRLPIAALKNAVKLIETRAPMAVGSVRRAASLARRLNEIRLAEFIKRALAKSPPTYYPFLPTGQRSPAEYSAASCASIIDARASFRHHIRPYFHFPGLLFSNWN